MTSSVRREPQEEKGERKHRGSALDGWLRVDQMLYQVEIKFYAAGADGWKKTPVPGDEEKLKEIAKDHWAKRWDPDEKTFRYSAEGKVLLPMPLEEKERRECKAPEPLICYWGLLHPSGELAEPLFSVQVGESVKISTEQKENRKKNPGFNTVWVFSMSAYLRKILLKERKIDLELPELAARLRRLNQFFSAGNEGDRHPETRDRPTQPMIETIAEVVKQNLPPSSPTPRSAILDPNPPEGFTESLTSRAQDIEGVGALGGLGSDADHGNEPGEANGDAKG